MLSRLVVTLMTSLALLLVPAGTAHALGLGGVFSDAAVEIDLVKQSKDQVVIDVRGSEYSGESLEIALNPSGYVGSGTRSTFIKSVSYDPDSAEDWSYRFTLDAAQIAQLDPGTSYQIMTMRDNGRDVLSSGDTETAKIPFDFDQLTQPDPEPSPTTPRTPSDDGGDSSSGGSSGGSTSGGSSGSTSGGGSGKSGGSGEKSDDEAEKGPWTAPEKPPTTKGIELGGADERSVDADDVIHASASGFKPNETGIRVVVYSSPIVLSTSVKANGHGVAKWSGRLPKDIGLGKHTLTFQGSVDRGIQFVVTGAPADGECAEGGCAKAPVSETPSAASAGGEPSMGWLTWVIVAAMIFLAAIAGTVAMLSGRRGSGSRDWDDRGYDQAPPRYTDGPAYADPAAYAYQQPGEHPSRPRAQQAQQAQYQQAQPQPSHRGGPPDQRQPGQRQPGQRQPGQRQPGQRQTAPRQPLQRQQAPREPVQREPGQREPAQREPAQREQAPQQAAHRRPRPPESFAPPQQRAEAFAPWR